MTDISLEGRVIIVTGGARGLGRAMAHAFAAAGAKGIALFDINSDAELAAVVSEIREIAGEDRGLAVSGDVTSWADCQRAVEETVERFGRIDVLVNNAARGNQVVGGEGKPFWEADPEGHRTVMDININGPFLMAKAALSPMLRQGSGKIINITKNREAMHAGLNSPYGPSKAAVEAETISWAEDLVDTGVTANSLSPGGAVDTDFIEPEKRERGRAEGRYMQPEIIGPCAVWLASNLSDDINGCRYVAKYWDDTLPPDAAAEKCREVSIFRPTRRPSKLTKTWEPTGDGE